MNSFFLKIDGAEGESLDSFHSGWCDVQSFSWGNKRNSEQSGTGKIIYHHLTAHCDVDRATSAALLLSSNGSKIKSVKLSVSKAGGDQIESFCITLENVIIMEVFIHDYGDKSRVTYEFQADCVKFQYWPQLNSGIRGGRIQNRMGYKKLKVLLLIS